MRWMKRLLKQIRSDITFFSAASIEKNELMRVYTIREVTDNEVRRQRISKVLQEQNPNSLSIKFSVEIVKSPIGIQTQIGKEAYLNLYFFHSITAENPVKLNLFNKLFMSYYDYFEDVSQQHPLAKM